MQINNYNVSQNARTNQASNSKMGGMSGAGNSLTMQDFLNLLASQLANQDVMNPMDDTQFIAQMAQFTSLQTMQTMTEITYAQYGASMVGKNVIVAEYSDKGDIVTHEGLVTKVTFSGGSCIVTVNGKEYDMSQIMEVKIPGSDPEKPPEGGDGDTEKPPVDGEGDKATLR